MKTLTLSVPPCRGASFAGRGELVPAALSRSDIASFLARLGYLESAATTATCVGWTWSPA